MMEDEMTLRAAVADVSRMRIFFGHQSVGRNILTGVSELAAGLDAPLEIKKLTQNSLSGPGIYEAQIGTNKQPASKIRDFSQTLHEIGEESVDVAMMKFCYVDAAARPTGQALFTEYIEAMERLEQECPDVLLVYMTMPLTSPGTDLKNSLRRWLRRGKLVDGGRQENVERNEFNRLLRAEKGDSGKLFDIAELEARTPAGRRHTIEMDGQSYEALFPAYTYDGGHLNSKGRRRVAEELIMFLSTLGDKAVAD